MRSVGCGVGGGGGGRSEGCGVGEGGGEGMKQGLNFHLLVLAIPSFQAGIQDFEMGLNFCNNVIEPKPG